MIILAIFLGILAVIALWVIKTHNDISQTGVKVDTQWSQIDVQLKMRTDLIPNLIETIKGYAAHEKELIEKVAKSRENLLRSSNMEEEMAAEKEFTAHLGRLMAISESYPELKANESFKKLQDQLSAQEQRIADFRQFYNDTVMMYNQKLVVFPANMIAGMFHFAPKAYYHIDEADRKNVTVSF